ncbi:MAG: bifunctional adenosylcobinamide kinase/adenosylcobinamide-phosphate guanylyltransferase [Pseudomonadota bacterium]
MTVEARSFFVLGGARSGKSRYAQKLAEGFDGSRTYIATAQAFDDEMRERIARHQADRDTSWETVEAPIGLADAILEQDSPENVILVDCLTLWLSNLLLAEHDLEVECAALTSMVPDLRARIVFVSNEVGLSVVPDNALARRFRDAAGLLNQDLARICDQSEFMVAGYPIRLGAVR